VIVKICTSDLIFEISSLLDNIIFIGLIQNTDNNLTINIMEYIILYIIVLTINYTEILAYIISYISYKELTDT
jgi:hypothetical protein